MSPGMAAVQQMGGETPLFDPLRHQRGQGGALALALLLGISGNFVLGQVLGHPTNTVLAPRRTPVTRSAGHAVVEGLKTATPPSTPAVHSTARTAPARPVSGAAHTQAQPPAKAHKRHAKAPTSRFPKRAKKSRPGHGK